MAFASRSSCSGNSKFPLTTWVARPLFVVASRPDGLQPAVDTPVESTSCSPTTFLFRSPMLMLLLVTTLLGLGGCSGTNEDVSLIAQGIAKQLRDYDERIVAPDANAKYGLLRALASNSPEMMAQAAVAIGKSRSVDTVVKQRLVVIAMSDESRLPQFAALQAFSRLGLLTSETHAVIEQLAADEIWGPIAAQIEH